MATEPKRKSSEFDIIEPIGERVVIRKDDNKRETRSGIVLPDSHEIPVITGRVIAISKAIENDEDQSIRNLDMVCRIRGEEFVIVLPNTNAEMAAKIADRMCRSVSAKPFNVCARTGPLPITVSIGVAAVEGSSDTLEALMKRADEALYSAKRAGRNRVNSTAA